MAVGPFSTDRLRRRTSGFQGLVTRIREDEAAVRDATPQPEPAPEPFSNTVALLRERDLDTGLDPAVPVVARVDEPAMVDIDLENGFVLTPQGFVQKPGAKPDPVAVFDRDTGRLTPLSGLERLQPGPGGDPATLLAALQHDVDRVLRREGEAEAEVLVPFGPEQFREAAREPAEPFDLLGVRRREIEARPPVTFEQAAAQVEPIPERPERPPLELTANQAGALQIPDISKVSEFQRETVAGEWFRNADAASGDGPRLMIPSARHTTPSTSPAKVAISICVSLPVRPGPPPCHGRCASSESSALPPRPPSRGRLSVHRRAS